MMPYILHTTLSTPSLQDLLPLCIMAALHEPIGNFCPVLLRLLADWWTAPQKLLKRGLGLAFVLGILCHGEATDLRQVAEHVTNKGLHVQDTGWAADSGDETHKVGFQTLAMGHTKPT